MAQVAFAAGQANIPQGFGHRDSGWFARTKDAIDLPRKTVQKILRNLVSCLARRAAVLIAGNQFQLREMRRVFGELSEGFGSA